MYTPHFNRVFHEIFTIHFGGFPPIFGSTPIYTLVMENGGPGLKMYFLLKNGESSRGKKTHFPRLFGIKTSCWRREGKDGLFNFMYDIYTYLLYILHIYIYIYFFFLYISIYIYNIIFLVVG